MPLLNVQNYSDLDHFITDDLEVLTMQDVLLELEQQASVQSIPIDQALQEYYEQCNQSCLEVIV